MNLKVQLTKVQVADLWEAMHIVVDHNKLLEDISRDTGVESTELMKARQALHALGHLLTMQVLEHRLDND